MFSSSRLCIQQCGSKSTTILKNLPRIYHSLYGAQFIPENWVPRKASLLDRLFARDTEDAPRTINRWTMFFPAVLTHVSLGAPYGWSAISSALAREHGFVVSAASDWGLELTTYPVAIWGFAGISTAILGSWQMKVSLRRSMATGGILYGCGMGLCGAGVMTHSLPLLYTGSLLWGLAYGCAYTAPIQALLNWFPDKKGLASGIVLGGFGSGALVFTPAITALRIKFSTLPTFLGSNLEVVVENGRQLAWVGGRFQEVVFATASDLAKLPYEGLTEGFYLVGSGNTGVAASLATIGVIYAANIFLASVLMQRPPKNYLPEGFTHPKAAGAKGSNVHVDDVMKTPQFWQLWSTAILLSTGGFGLMAVAVPMMENVFTGSMPSVVTPAFAFSYLMAMAAGNLGGRLFWATLSDKIGRWNTFQAMTIMAIPLYGSIPFFVNNCMSDPTGPLAKYYLAGFCVSTIAAISVLGGVFAVLPAYQADMYGCKYIGPIHGRMLTFSTCSAVLGPTMLLNLRKMAEGNAINDLLLKVDPDAFLSKFGATIENAQTLIEAKTLTISQLMTIMPPGTVDPSPFLYNNTMFTMAGLVSVASVIHFMVKPVDKKFYETDKKPR